MTILNYVACRATPKGQVAKEFKLKDAMDSLGQRPGRV